MVAMGDGAGAGVIAETAGAGATAELTWAAGATGRGGSFCSDTAGNGGSGGGDFWPSTASADNSPAAISGAPLNFLP